ncbi:hypothetical protein B425_4108 [Bacillus amyloliquefaciens]|nr:hypothetical protein B425_4108 [Bacillus amyloliquefaciens]
MKTTYRQKKRLDEWSSRTPWKRLDTFIIRQLYGNVMREYLSDEQQSL